MPTPRALLRFVVPRLGLERYLAKPGDGRQQPVIAARVLLWAMVVGRVLRECSFLGVEPIVRVAGCRVLGLQRSFSNDALNYLGERLDPSTTRSALIDLVRQAKRGKAFQDCRFLGLAVDGTGAGRSRESHCDWCRPIHDAQLKVLGYHHQVVAMSVVGTGLTLPFEVEPYGPGDSEYAAAQRLLTRARRSPGNPLCRLRGGGWRVCPRPLLAHRQSPGTARRRAAEGESPPLVGHRAAALPAASSHPRLSRWKRPGGGLGCGRLRSLGNPAMQTVRAFRYRQHKPDGKLVEATWLTDFPSRQVSSLSLYHMAKSRWQMENQTFNDAKNRYGFEHTCHHEKNSVLLNYLITLLALTIERLYRIRYLHRGTHAVRSAEQLCRLLWVSLSRPLSPNTS